MITRTIEVGEMTEPEGRKIEKPVAVAKNFIPASEIASFLPAGLRY
jgi:hypothetical protein